MWQIIKSMFSDLRGVILVTLALFLLFAGFSNRKEVEEGVNQVREPLEKVIETIKDSPKPPADEDKPLAYADYAQRNLVLRI